MEEIGSLKKLLLEAFRANQGIVDVLGTEIYDVYPTSKAKPTFPYLTLGPFSSTDVGAECFESADVTGQVDIWSAGDGHAASTRQSVDIAGMIKTIVRGLADRVEGDYRISDIRVSSSSSLTDADGKTKHAIVTVSAIVDLNI